MSRIPAIFFLSLVLMIFAGCTTPIFAPAPSTAVPSPSLKLPLPSARTNVPPPMPAPVVRTSALAPSMVPAAAVPLTFVKQPPIVRPPLMITVNYPPCTTLQCSSNLQTWTCYSGADGPVTVSPTDPFLFFRDMAPACLLLTWVPVPSTNVAGYKIYCGSVSLDYTNVIDAGLTNRIVVRLPTLCGTNYFAITSYDATGRESDFSTPEVTWLGVMPTVSLNTQ